ncbi:penicillin acylase family protein [Conexibacter woesei]|uniref:Penicillin amidase n=1 Tax=Conexibacter woesei (strain DSM 14684 / CCUG 47730 / CIP 108061 / JCM 11494 / NBRC 100937 / ID131577) TaxID=469383 RepID=D3F2A4_CONWI|nr:penicillin acylase family protein [Conexibacter woesei]ADB50279.1 Penicillin amidase [Conexibacter woesei DSM 14684]
MRRPRLAAFAALLLAAGGAGATGGGSALAAPPVPAPYGHDDPGGFRDILPPGTNGAANTAQLTRFLGSGVRPPHNDDQLGPYADLVRTPLPLGDGDLDRLFKDATFGVRADDVERTYSPRDDVTIVRDRAFGVPRVYGATRAGTMFGAGWVAAEDRLFFIDVLRHLGRAQLAAFAGGSPGNVAMDREQWRAAPYAEADLTAQLAALPRRYGASGRSLLADVDAYTAGVNAYIAAARADPAKMPGEYLFSGHPEGPAPWRREDAVAIASLVGATFGNGGGGELDEALLLQGFERRFGARLGRRLWSDWRSAEDPEAPTTVRGRSFPYDAPPRRPARGSLALPDRGSVVGASGARAASGSGREALAAAAGAGGAAAGDGKAGAGGAAAGGEALPGLLAPFPGVASNALLVAGSASRSGRPLAVFGPQVGYFSPQILMEQELHGPGIDARGAAFAGVNMYVQLGRGRDYSWSATSAGQDIIDTYAVPLCDPRGGRPGLRGDHYRLGGRCLRMETLTRRDAWTPSAADQTPAGAIVLRAQRTRLGIVVARATIGGRPVAYVERRSTYMRELDSARGFAAFNMPGRIRDARGFQRAAALVDYTFNWFYADDRDVAYFNSGANPVRPAGVDGNLPTAADFGWKRIGTPFAQHPQALNQRVLTSWNNKQAPGFAAAAPQTFTSIYRSQLLDDAISERMRGGRRLTLPDLASAMASAATVDLRGAKVLPWALRALGTPRDPQLERAVGLLNAWVRDGAHRRAPRAGGPYAHAEAIRIIDAWWPLWLTAQFEPRLGRALYAQLRAEIPQDDPPVGRGREHHGSAYQTGWYGYAQKDLRSVLGAPVRGRYAREYCGGGSPRRCRDVLGRSLRAALRVPAATVYRDPFCARRGEAGSQTCFDSIAFRALGGITQPPIPWMNRPTYQQVVEVRGHRPR